MGEVLPCGEQGMWGAEEEASQEHQGGLHEVAFKLRPEGGVRRGWEKVKGGVGGAL